MKGEDISSILNEDPDLLYAWELYQLCREQQLIMYEKPTGKKDGSKVLTPMIWPTGFSVLPNGSSVHEQDYMTMKYFHGFLLGEREGARDLIRKKGR